jgi:hypothetical protein
MLIGVINESSLVSDEDAYNMTLLVNHQLRNHAAPAFDRLPPEVHYFPSASAVPAGTFVIGILDNADQAGVLGYHELGFGRVFAGPVLANGGGILAGELSVASVLSHEALESWADLYANLWGDLGTGTCYAYELGDPVESDTYIVKIVPASGLVSDAVTGTVSNFVLPSWFDPDGQAPYDYMGLLTGPFQVRQDGYVIAMSDGNVTEQWGEHYPPWRKATKASPSSRTARRHAKAFSATILT